MTEAGVEGASETGVGVDAETGAETDVEEAFEVYVAQQSATQQHTAQRILEKVALGEGISPDEAKALIDPASADLEEIVETAHGLTRRVFGNVVTKCAIYPAKVGLCSGDCAFCAQSVHHNCNVEILEPSALDEQKIIENAQELHRRGVQRYSLVTSGERLTKAEFAVILRLLRRLREESKMGLCASLGSLTAERAAALKEAGLTRYHCNVETSRSFYPHICSTHSYDDKQETIRLARQAGLEICSGGILGMGETPEQRIEMAFELKELEVACIPLNILDPLPGTKLENQERLSPDEILRAIALFRLILPRTTLKFAGGREKALGSEEYRGYRAGINSVLVGNYLTTSGKAFDEELQNLAGQGLF